jgi:hypothetical protein
MIAVPQVSLARSAETATRRKSTFHREFLNLLPAIRRHARICFRRLGAEACEEAIQAALAHAWVGFKRLAERDRIKAAFATPLARYAVARVWAGREVGARLNVNDVTSIALRRRKCIGVQRLAEFHEHDAKWQEILVEDRRASPADVAATRIDFQAWLSGLPGRLRLMAETLATGEDTAVAACRFGVTPGRVSQVRRELQRAWRRFQGELNTGLGNSRQALRAHPCIRPDVLQLLLPADMSRPSGVAQTRGPVRALPALLARP